jgi:hypothetical protein
LRVRRILRPCGSGIDVRGDIDQAQELGLTVGGLVAQVARDVPILNRLFGEHYELDSASCALAVRLKMSINFFAFAGGFPENYG